MIAVPIPPYTDDELVLLNTICEEEGAISGINPREIFVSLWHRKLPLRCVRDIIRRAADKRLSTGHRFEDCIEPAIFASVLETTAA